MGGLAHCTRPLTSPTFGTSPEVSCYREAAAAGRWSTSSRQSTKAPAAAFATSSCEPVAWSTLSRPRRKHDVPLWRCYQNLASKFPARLCGLTLDAPWRQANMLGKPQGDGTDKAGTATERAVFFIGAAPLQSCRVKRCERARSPATSHAGLLCGEPYQGTDLRQTALSAHEARTF